MTIRCGGMLPSITNAAQAIAAAVTAIVIACQLRRRKSPPRMQRYFSFASPPPARTNHTARCRIFRVLDSGQPAGSGRAWQQSYFRLGYDRNFNRERSDGEDHPNQPRGHLEAVFELFA